MNELFKPEDFKYGTYSTDEGSVTQYKLSDCQAKAIADATNIKLQEWLASFRRSEIKGLKSELKGLQKEIENGPVVYFGIWSGLPDRLATVQLPEHTLKARLVRIEKI